MLDLTYDNIKDINACKNCINSFDSVCFLFDDSSELFNAHYEFDLNQIHELIKTPKYGEIFKVYLRNQ
jgi:hypothetical protein